MASLTTDIVQSNSGSAFVDNSFVLKEFTFDDSLFPYSPDVLDINVSVFFAKSADDAFRTPTQSLEVSTPYLSEMRLVLYKNFGLADQFGVVLINSDSPLGDGSFDNGDPVGFRQTVVFDEEAVLAVNHDRDQISGGNFRPADGTDVSQLFGLTGTFSDSLSSFYGMDGRGVWTLRLEDVVDGDGLHFYSADVTLTVSAVPEPSTMALLGCIGTVAAWRSVRTRRRRRR